MKKYNSGIDYETGIAILIILLSFWILFNFFVDF
jgi:hypothetical protein